MRIKILFILFLLINIPFLRAQDKPTEKEFSTISKKAGKGNAKALYQLGKCYENGWYVDKDETLAALQYQESANNNYPPAMSAYGYYLML